MKALISQVAETLIDEINKRFNIDPFSTPKSLSNVYEEAVSPNNTISQIKAFAERFIRAANLNGSDANKLLKVIQSTNNIQNLLTKLSLYSA